MCCGIIFKGLNGEVLVDPQLLHPCWSCRKDKIRHENGQRLASPDDTDSNISTPSNSELDFPNSASTIDDVEDVEYVDEGEEDLSVVNLECDETLDTFNSTHALTLEC